MIPALALTAGLTVSPNLAQASTCDNTFVKVAVTDAAGRVPPVPPQGSELDSRDPGRQVTLSLGSSYHFLTRGGVIRPNGAATFVFVRDTVVMVQERRAAGTDGVIHPAAPLDASQLQPGDQIEVQALWDTTSCGPSGETLGIINVVS